MAAQESMIAPSNRCLGSANGSGRGLRFKDLFVDSPQTGQTRSLAEISS